MVALSVAQLELMMVVGWVDELALKLVDEMADNLAGKWEDDLVGNLVGQKVLLSVVLREFSMAVWKAE